MNYNYMPIYVHYYRHLSHFLHFMNKQTMSQINLRQLWIIISLFICVILNQRAFIFLTYSWTCSEFMQCRCVCDCKITVDKQRDNWKSWRQRQSQVRETNPVSNKQGNKASAATQTSQLAANQPARPLSSQTEAGSRNWPSREIEKERETDKERKREGVFITQKHLSSFSSLSCFCFIPPQRDTVGKGDRHR